MTIHNFPSKPLRNPARELGLSDVPLPPTYAIRDMERAHGRFVDAIACDRHPRGMPPEALKRARSDLSRYRDVIAFEEIEGINVVKTDSINHFVHRVTGHPKAWILSWQIHSYATTLAGLALDRPEAVASFRAYVDEATAAFSNSFNREFKH